MANSKLNEEIRRYLNGDSQALKKEVNKAKKRLAALAKEAKDRFRGRDETINVVLASLASGVPAVLLGPPGTGKSAIVRTIASLCGLSPKQDDYFEYILTSHTMPEELFGPPDLEALRKGVFRRNTNGMLPRAKFAFLDEVFRGSSQILNTLLSILNERIFHNGNAIEDMDLIGIIAAANSTPTDSELNAFYDRFPIRTWVKSVFEENEHGEKLQDTSASLLKKSLELDLRNLSEKSTSSSETPKNPASVDDFRILRAHTIVELRAFMAQVSFQEFSKNFAKFRTSCHLSDRSFFAFARFAIAWNWLSTAKSGHHEVFNFVAPDESKARDVRRKLEQSMLSAGHGNNF